MKELYNTTTFISCVIKDSKPVLGEYASYCSYCKEIAIKDFTYDEYTRYDYIYCNCIGAELEKEFKKKLEILKRKQANDLWNLKQEYKDKGIFIK